MITPFTSEGQVDVVALEQVIEFLVPTVDGLFVCGTYGSGPLMNLEQRKQVAEICVKRVAGRIPVIVQVGTPDTASAVELARAAEEAGADAVASVAPYYFHHTYEGLKSYFQALIHGVQIPVYAYNNPTASGNSLSPKLIRELADEGLAGLKDSSFDMVTFYGFARALAGKPFNLIVGTEALAYPALKAGAAGIVSGVANVYPEVVKQLADAVTAGRDQEALELQYKVLSLRETIKLGPTVPICHAILEMRGVTAGVPKAPMHPITPELRDQVAARLREIGV